MRELFKRAYRSNLTPNEKNSLGEKNRNYKRVERLRKITVSANNEINNVETAQSSASDDIAHLQQSSSNDFRYSVLDRHWVRHKGGSWLPLTR